MHQNPAALKMAAPVPLKENPVLPLMILAEGARDV
jgi:hypothetical protein